jgi:hypothetical protein
MKSLYALRAVAGLHAVAICLQPILAGIYLNGTSPAMRVHEPLGLGLTFLGLFQLVVATIWWRSGGRLLAPAVALLITVGEVLQVSMGYSRQLAIHIPLGIALVATAIAFACWAGRQQPATRPRKQRRSRRKEPAVTA